MNSIPRSPGIYKITCLANGKIYIGSSTNLYKRCNKHQRLLIKNKHYNHHLQAAWNKYGADSFVFEVIELVMPWSLTGREQYWLDKLACCNSKRGFNNAKSATSPGQGHIHTPEARAKIKSARTEQGNPWTGNHHKPESKERISAALRVRLVKTETRKKLSDANKGNKNRVGFKETPETISRKIASAHTKTYSVISPSGDEFIITNLSKFCKENQLSYPNMSSVATGKRKHHKGWRCRYA